MRRIWNTVLKGLVAILPIGLTLYIVYWLAVAAERLFSRLIKLLEPDQYYWPRLGLIAGLVCLWAVTALKNKLGYDDSLDVFGVHCIGGIVGAILTGVFNAPSLGGTDVYDYVANAFPDPAAYDMGAHVVSQLWGVGVTLLWSGLVSLIAFKLIDLTIGLRVNEEQEREGLDTVSHGERAYNG